MKLIIDIPASDYKAICVNKEDAIIAHDTCRRIAHGIPLDSIKAEIQENINYNKKMNYLGIVAGLLLALDIIDYKAESEE